MDEKKITIRGLENQTIREYMEKAAQEKVDKAFPGKQGRQRPRNPLKKVILLKWREEDGSDHGSI